MSCCAATGLNDSPESTVPDPSAWVRDAGSGLKRLDLLVPGIHCAGCISRIERGLKAIAGVEQARVNMSTRRVGVVWRSGAVDPAELVATVVRLGYRVQPFDATGLAGTDDDETAAELLRALAVAGFAAANVMLLSVSVWSGAEAATRDLFHWISGLIALPAVAYSGRPFFRSAWRALKGGGLNMDVPISLAVILAAGMSLYETLHHGDHAYFDASVSLLFFLLIGRFLDHRMRARARSSVAELIALNATGATLVEADGGRRYVPVADIRPGMSVLVTAGERVPVDGRILRGTSDLDRSLVTGETVPEPAGPGSLVHAGVLNLSGPIEIAVLATGAQTFLSEVVRLMEQAEQGKARYVALADHMARIYAPAVHVLAAATLIGWLIASGGDWRASVLAAIAVLIITCPCALGLAVPVVQVVASGVLFRAGIMVKDGAGLEKLSEIDTVVFDKTGTLTYGRPDLVTAPLRGRAGDIFAVAAGLARGSRHPLSKALVAAASARAIAFEEVDNVREVPGNGLEGVWRGRAVQLGRAAWLGVDGDRAEGQAGELEMWCRIGDQAPVRLAFRDKLREDARETVAALKARGLAVELLSGDRESAVRAAAEALAITQFTAAARPQDKMARLEALARQGRRVLMVGDGINDAPALAAAHASMSPGTAADVSRTAATFVFVNDRLGSLVDAIDTSRRATRLIKQNFALAILYNVFAVPLAMAGLASPLIAAIAMSSSSLVVTGNALRLRLGRARGARRTPVDGTDRAQAAPAFGQAA